MTARVIPGFIVGPVAGVIADRWDRRRTMVVADVLRAVVIFSLPIFPNLLYLLVASMVLESASLVWGPAKDASLPHVVPARYLTHANSLSLIGIYGPWPLASIFYVLLETLGNFVAGHVGVLSGLRGEPETMALWLDSATFATSALIIWSLTIPASRRRAGKLDIGEVKRDLIEGLRFVVDHDKVRPWIIGIAFTFTAAGGVFSLGPSFVNDVLAGGGRGFAFVLGFLATGMIAGLLAVGLIAKKVSKDVIFSSAILLLGASLILLASMSSLEAAVPIASMLGFFGGAAYSTGYALIHENTADELKGRTFSAAYTVIRIGTLVGLGLFPFVAGAMPEGEVSIGDFDLALPGARTTLWLAGLFVLAGGVYSMQALKDRSGGRGAHGGFFVVFEGGEGAGKSTQMERFVGWLRTEGEDVVSTREPGGTDIGARIRSILLDRDAGDMDERTEALLYAADRAQHVAELIKPSLEAGKIVVSDRFLDSSLAYQGLARGLGFDRIYDLSDWATGGLLPDLVFFLKVDPDEGLKRVGDDRDRLESEDDAFHRKVASAYAELARRFPGRFVVLDGHLTEDEVQQQIRKAFFDRAHHVASAMEPGASFGPPGPVIR
jgi:dTMP kinase